MTNPFQFSPNPSPIILHQPCEYPICKVSLQKSSDLGLLNLLLYRHSLIELLWKPSIQNVCKFLWENIPNGVWIKLFPLHSLRYNGRGFRLSRELRCIFCHLFRLRMIFRMRFLKLQLILLLVFQFLVFLRLLLVLHNCL